MEVIRFDEKQLKSSCESIIDTHIASLKKEEESINQKLEEIEKIRNKDLEFSKIIELVKSNSEDITTKEELKDILNLLNIFSESFDYKEFPDVQYTSFLDMINPVLDKLNKKISIELEKCENNTSSFEEYKNIKTGKDTLKLLKELEQSSDFSIDEKTEIIKYFAYLSAANKLVSDRTVQNDNESNEIKVEIDENKPLENENSKKEEIKNLETGEEELKKVEEPERDLKVELSSIKKGAKYIIEKREKTNFVEFYDTLIQMDASGLSEEKSEALKSFRTAASEMKNLFEGIEDIYQRLPENVNAKNEKDVETWIKRYNDLRESFKEKYSSFVEKYRKFHEDFGNIVEKKTQTASEPEKKVEETKEENAEIDTENESEIKKPKKIKNSINIFKRDKKEEPKEIVDEAPESIELSAEDIEKYKKLYKINQDLLAKLNGIKDLNPRLTGLQAALEAELSMGMAEEISTFDIQALESFIKSIRRAAEETGILEDLFPEEIEIPELESENEKGGR